jgi:putative ABC transport system ATP-binding protein
MMVTHDPGAAVWSDRLVLLRDGTISDDRPSPPAVRDIAVFAS